jgi:EmrB/QacA subfamily drug resistance transporter
LNDMEDSTSTGVNKWVTLIIAATSQFLVPFSMGSLNVALPSIGRELAMDAVLLGWVATSYVLVTAAFLVPFGRLADIYGRKRIFGYGIYLFIISSLLCAMASSGVLLVAFRVLQGISAAMTGGTAIAILTSVFPGKERGRAIGISIAAVYLGLTLGPFMGGIMTEQFRWPSIFYLSAALGVVVVSLFFWKLKGEWAEARGEKFDLVGAAVFSFSLVMVMYGFSVLTTVLGVVLFVLGLLGLLVFVWWEAKVASPVFNIGVFRKNTVFVFSNLAALINYSGTFAATFFMSLYLQYIQGFSPQTAGLVLMASSVIMTIFAPVAGRLSDRIEPRKVAAIGMALSGVSLALLIFLNETTALWYIVASLMVAGLGIAFFSSPNTNAVMGSVGKQFFGVASGTQGSMRSSGMMVSMGIIMILFSIYIGQAEIVPENYPAFMESARVGFIIFSSLCFAGIFAQLAGRRSRQE